MLERCQRRLGPTPRKPRTPPPLRSLWCSTPSRDTTAPPTGLPTSMPRTSPRTYAPCLGPEADATRSVTDGGTRAAAPAPVPVSAGDLQQRRWLVLVPEPSSPPNQPSPLPWLQPPAPPSSSSLGRRWGGARPPTEGPRRVASLRPPPNPRAIGLVEAGRARGRRCRG